MKTLISLNDSLLKETDAAARDLGITRNGLIAKALQAFLKLPRQSLLTEQLNRAYPMESRVAEGRFIQTFKTKLKIQDTW